MPISLCLIFIIGDEYVKVKVIFMTQWRDKQIVCCCPLINKCNKDHSCEELDFYYDPYDGLYDYMKRGEIDVRRCAGR